MNRPPLSLNMDRSWFGIVTLLGQVTLLLLPAGLLLGAALRPSERFNLPLWAGTSFQVLVCFLTFVSSQSRHHSVAQAVVTLYLTALAWLWFGDKSEDSYNHFAKSILIVVPVAVFAYETFMASGAATLRRANLLVQRLTNRQEWPADLLDCRSLPDVKALRAALIHDAGPALALLNHARAEVRVAALAALEFRKDWRPGQAELVLQVAQRAEHPAIRAAAVMALANVEDRVLVETLAQRLQDPSREVRKAAIDALLWDLEHRWGWIRHALRRVLADPLFANDGPLLPDGHLLTDEAVNDMAAWCAEKGIVSARAAQTLAAHHHRSLLEHAEPHKVIDQLRAQLADPRTPAILRLELGRLLQSHQALTLELLESMLPASCPATLRLIACETILADHPNTRQADAATSALRDLARLPNREIALATADVVQRRVGVDLGLGLNQPLPPVQSKQAVEVARRVIQWANQFNDEDELERSGMPAKSRWR
jgi:hypothetical protein